MADDLKHHGPADRLDAALAALRGLPVPPGPPAELVARTVERVCEGERTGPSKKGWWTMRMARQSAVAAGIMLVATVGMFWLLLGGGGRGGAAFADVVEQVRTAKAVRCKMTFTIEAAPGGALPGGGAMPTRTEADVLWVEPGWTITTTRGAKTIYNLDKARMLMLIQQGRQAILVDQKNAQPVSLQRLNLFEEFRKFDTAAGKPVGERVVAGRKTRGYAIERNGMRMEVWADLQTDRPVLVEARINSPLVVGTYVMTDFDWNPTFDPADLTFDVPAGFHAATAQVDASKASEADVANLLKVFADVNGGAYPANIHMTALTDLLSKLIGARGGITPGGQTPEQLARPRQELFQTVAPSLTQVSRGWQFMADRAQGTQWTYAGAGVKAGEKGRPVLWYRTPQGAWRAFDADLTAHDIREADLPKGEPVEMVTPPATAPATLP